MRSKEEREVSAQICLGCHKWGAKRESSPRCGDEGRRSSGSPYLPQEMRWRWRKGEKLQAGKGKEKAVAGRIHHPGRKRREGRGKTDSDGGGTRGAWESWLAPGRAYSEDSSNRSSAKNGCFASTTPSSPPPNLLFSFTLCLSCVWVPVAQTYQAEEVGMAILQAGPVRHEAGTHPHSHNPHAIIPQPPTRKKETDREREREREETDTERERGEGGLCTRTNNDTIK